MESADRQRFVSFSLVPTAMSRPVVLVLVGAPGSGKSTLSTAIIDRARDLGVIFARINQDVLKTRQACLRAAADALRSSQNVIIDRVNFNAEQRSYFLQLAGEFSAVKHAIFLDVDEATCIRRTRARTEHEGRVQGPASDRIVHGMALRMELPSLAEGFSLLVKSNPALTADGMAEWYLELG